MAKHRHNHPPAEAELTRQTVTHLQEQMRRLTTAVQDLALELEGYIKIQQQEEESDTKDNPFAIMKQGFKFELPEFHGTQSADEVLGWISTVEETLEFKHVPLDQCVPMITKRFRGSAASWWSKLKTSRARLNKPKVLSWDKLKKKMRKTFLPFNYDQVVLERLQNLRQGRRSVEEYSNEFMSLLRHVDLHESDQQIVACFVRGLGQKFQYHINLLKPLTVAEAYQHALIVEAQNKDIFVLELEQVGLFALCGCVAYTVLSLAFNR